MISAQFSCACSMQSRQSHTHTPHKETEWQTHVAHTHSRHKNETSANQTKQNENRHKNRKVIKCERSMLTHWMNAKIETWISLWAMFVSFMILWDWKMCARDAWSLAFDAKSAVAVSKCGAIGTALALATSIQKWSLPICILTLRTNMENADGIGGNATKFTNNDNRRRWRAINTVSLQLKSK